MFSVNIKAITILTGGGPDHLLIESSLPNGCYPYNGNGMMKMDVAAGSGVRYCEKNFPGVTLKTIDTGARL